MRVVVTPQYTILCQDTYVEGRKVSSERHRFFKTNLFLFYHPARKSSTAYTRYQSRVSEQQLLDLSVQRTTRLVNL